jgi:hypothetical protein
MANLKDILAVGLKRKQQNIARLKKANTLGNLPLQDIAAEAGVQGAGHAENFGIAAGAMGYKDVGDTLQNLGRQGEDYWRQFQSPRFNNLQELPRKAVSIATDPANMIAPAVSRWIKPAAGFLKARKVATPAAMFGLGAYDAADAGKEIIE